MLRPERAEDGAFLASLFRSAAAPLPGLPTAMIEMLLDMQFRSQGATYRAAYPDACFAIIERDGRPTGRLVVAPGDPALIVDYALLPGTRGKGLGGAVLAAVLDRIGQAVRSNVLADNVVCLAMCARLGFGVVGDEPPYRQLEWRP